MKTERSFSMPALLYRHSVTDELLKEFIAFVGVSASCKYVLLSKSESGVIEALEVHRWQLPPDVNVVYLKIEGTSGFVELRNRSVFKNFSEVNDRQLNQLIVQGSNPVAVRGLLSRVETVLRPQRFLPKTVFYGFSLMWYWSTLVLLWFGEYRAVKLFRAGLSLYAPLSAFGAFLIFAVALKTTLIYANVILPFFCYWFPYFEIEDNISTHRLSSQKFAGALWSSLIAAGVLNLISLLHK